jgi:hypothetical protein
LPVGMTPFTDTSTTSLFMSGTICHGCGWAQVRCVE